MEIGLQMIFASYGWNDIGDNEVYAEEVALAQLAEDAFQFGFGLLEFAQCLFLLVYTIVTLRFF